MSDFLSPGVQKNILDSASERFRDPRPTFRKISDFYNSPSMGTVLFVYGLAISSVFTAGLLSQNISAIMHKMHFSALSELFFLVFLIWPLKRIWSESFLNHQFATPFCDPKAPEEKAERGNYVIGKSRRTGVIIALNKALLMTHMLIFGGTGSGKSETIFTILFNSMLSGSGGVLCDGKADASLPIKVFGMARRIGREQDILMLSYIMGSKGQRKMRTPIARSNTMNPLVKGSASFCSEFMLNLMTSSEGDNAIFSKRAESFVKAYMRIMEFLRDTGRMDPFIGEFAEDVSLLKKLAGFCADPTIPNEVRAPMRAYLITTHGSMDDVINSIEKGMPLTQIVINKGAEQQHGFVSMQLIEPLSILGQDYGHIFNVREYDIDMNDVMVNRRILLGLIPALEKSQESLQGLGKVVIASMKAMLAEVMDGGNLTGKVDNIINKRPTNSPMAFPSIFDEIGYYMVPGIAVIPAQARSLGVGFVFAGQDKPAFTKLVDTEADSIIANTLLKMTGLLEDETTGDIFVKRAGKTHVTESTGTSNEHSSTGDHADSGNTNLKEVDRLNIRDLYNQRSGQFLVMNKDNFDFVQIMYMGTLRQPTLHQVNQKVPMPTLKEEDIEGLLNSGLEQEDSFLALLSSPPVIEELEPLDVVMTSPDMVIAFVMGGLNKKGGEQEEAQKNLFEGFSVPKEIAKDQGAPANEKTSKRHKDSCTFGLNGASTVGTGDMSHIGVFNYLDEESTRFALDEATDAVSIIHPAVKNDTDNIIEIAKANSTYPERKPFSRSSSGKKCRTVMLGDFIVALGSEISGKTRPPGGATTGILSQEKLAFQEPLEGAGLAVPEKKPVLVSSNPMDLVAAAKGQDEDEDEQ